MKKQIILFGAYDRYNYGDNLMPIVFSLFIEKYYPAVFETFELKFCSIGNADLSKYKCLKSQSINEILLDTPDDSILVVIGGEVLCASNVTLFLHIQNSRFTHRIANLFRFFMRRYLTIFTKPFYGTKWEFPYIPPKSVFKNRVKMAYNTIGGGISGLSKSKKNDVVKRLQEADYISVRDSRTNNDVKNDLDVSVYPDSVFLLPDVISDEFLISNINKEVKIITNKEYICFQASPHKIGQDIGDVVLLLKEMSEACGCKILLLPIGYASGHDDVYYLDKVVRKLPNHTMIAKDLSVWEIMYIIKSSRAFIGTSLHGVITSMAYSIPHFGLNPGIGKVNSFLNDWSIAPFNKSYNLKEISNLMLEDYSGLTAKLEENSARIIELVKENNSNIIKLCIG